jgi:lysophospholipase L1-like esterase
MMSAAVPMSCLFQRAAILAPLLLLAACGGGGGTGGSPTAPATPAVQTFPISIVVFYDENRNGALGPSEGVRLPNVAIASAGQSVRTSSGGAATLQVPSGEQRVAIAQESLPPYYQPGQPATVTVPTQSQLLLPVTLPIGTNNRPNTYMGFGDSITIGELSSDDQGYRPRLESRLAQYLGRAEVINEGVTATRSLAGSLRIGDSLRRQRPAYTLIHYGTNDWNERDCRDNFPCYTITSLRTIVRESKAQGSLPILATIIPSNTGYDARVPLERNEWLELLNALIREMANQEGVVIADQWNAFFQVKEIGTLFADHVHPNDAGYKIMADTWFDAITRSRAATSAQGAVALVHVPGLGFVRPEQAARTKHFPLYVPPDPWDSPGVQRR